MIQRYNPDYKMHAVRFEAFAREAEHGELVRFDAHQQVVSAVEAERDAQQKRADALAVENAALKDGFEWLYAIVSSDEVSIPDEKYSAVTNAAAVLSETPATDAALAAIRDAVLDRVIAKLGAMGSPDFTLMAVRALKNELREAK